MFMRIWKPRGFMTRTPRPPFLFSFFFNDTATTEIYTLSLHDALPIYVIDHKTEDVIAKVLAFTGQRGVDRVVDVEDRKSTRLNSSHGYISYAVFCLKKKKKTESLIVLTKKKKIKNKNK